MTDLPPILCPECEHSIDDVYLTFYLDWKCSGGNCDCDCDLSPSDIARALLTAEPSEAEIDAATDALLDAGHNGYDCRPDVPTDVTAARVLRAARKARA